MRKAQPVVEELVPQSVMAQYPDFTGGSVHRTGNGLINQTFLATSKDGERQAIFQRLHHIFAPTVNEDIQRVTDHLAHKGMTTPRIIQTASGKLWVTDDLGGNWRALTFVNGQCFDTLESPSQAQSAGNLVGRFHLALSDFEKPFAHVRVGVHDLNKHLTTLSDALANHPDHPLFSQVSAMAREVFEATKTTVDFASFPDRNVHGDLKISNLMFDASGKSGLCLIDLDTLGRQKWAFEMGDAMRSWCNPLGENASEVTLDVNLFQAATTGYFEALSGADFLSKQEVASLPDGLAYICLELTSRFLADALNESYFGFDATRFATRGEYNLLRARGQWALHQDVMRRSQDLKRWLAQTLS